MFYPKESEKISYKGEFKKNKMNGEGKLQFKDKYYEGQFKNNFFHG